jgi:hypothetical protein
MLAMEVGGTTDNTKEFRAVKLLLYCILAYIYTHTYKGAAVYLPRYGVYHFLL